VRVEAVDRDELQPPLAVAFLANSEPYAALDDSSLAAWSRNRGERGRVGGRSALGSARKFSVADY
jgi:hypothetical protein